jgi:TonB family protein
VAKDMKSADEKLKRRLSGRLFRYTLAASVLVHLGAWALIAWPDGDLGQLSSSHHKRGIVIPFEHVKELPPPSTIMPPEEPNTAPKGMPVKEGIGEIIIPSSEDDAYETARDPKTDYRNPTIDPGSRVTVEKPVDPVEKPKSASPDQIEFVSFSKAPGIIHQSRPEYPEIARSSHMEGNVVLLIYIDERGDVRNAVVQSSPGLPALDEAAINAAYKCKFTPAEQQGVPVGVWYSLVMEFRL